MVLHLLHQPLYTTVRAFQCGDWRSTESMLTQLLCQQLISCTSNDLHATCFPHNSIHQSLCTMQAIGMQRLQGVDGH
jgi:hypothetical protein